MPVKSKLRKNPLSFFPIQLLLDYLKYNRLILLSWLLPFLFITGAMGEKFGIPTLYLIPEYLGSVNTTAFLFSGLATGSFIMAFHIASYIAMVHRHPFVIRFSNPFYVYSLNNSVIPLIYILLYSIQSATFQSSYELLSTGTIIINLAAFLIGTALFIYLSFGLFYLLTRPIHKLFNNLQKNLKHQKRVNGGFFKKLIEKNADTKIKESPIEDEETTKVNYYLFSFFKIRRVGHFAHFPKNQFRKVFQYQHLNAFLYVSVFLIIIIVRGLIKDIPELIIPAGASFMIIFTVVILLISLLYIVFEEWTLVITLGLLILFGYFFPTSMLKYNESAYGMNYSIDKPIDVFSHGNFKQDSLNTIKILNNWKAKNTTHDIKNTKPKMVIICASGGGLKMSVWTYYALGYIDSILSGKLLQHTELITGASGGMLGAAYLRENYLRFNEGKVRSVFSTKRTNLLAKDILNPIFYTFSMSDWFFRLQTFHYRGKTYFKDRAYIFEETLNRNIGNVLDKPLAAYRKPVQQARIPIIILTPAIENVGSRLYISSTGVSYLTKSPKGLKIKNMELRHNYAGFQPDSLRYLSAIRMNATFPYVSPDVQMPGEPKMFIIDAGFNDNFGFMTAYLFVTEFKEWIEKNTSGIILIRLDENTKVDYHYISNPVKRMLRPLGSVFADYIKIQEENYMSVASSLNKMLPGKFKMINLAFGSTDKYVPLSWHLSKYDKQILFNSIHSAENQKNIEYLKKTLN